MSVVTYVKGHPIATGIIVLVGGIIFIMIVRGGGSSATPSGPSGPSDAQVMAGASLEAARINAGAAVSAASIGAGVQLNSDNKAAEVAMRQIEAAFGTEKEWIAAQKEVATSRLSAESNAIEQAMAAQQARNQSIISSLPGIKKKNRDDVLQALITGEAYYPQANPNHNPAAIIQSLGDSFGKFAGAIM